MDIDDYAIRRTGEEWYIIEAEAYDREHDKFRDSENYAGPLEHFLKAARIDKTKADSQYNIGILYFNGTYVSQNYMEAHKWFKKASDNGHAKAAEKIARLSYYGNGIDQSYRNASYWYKRAADLGDIEAQFRLGLIYHDGLGVPQDYKQAIMYYTAASSDGTHLLAIYNLGVLYQNRRADQRDYRQAFALYSKAAELEDKTSLFKVARWLEKGIGTEINYKKALSIYRQLVNDDYRSEAHYRIARMYSKGHGVSQNHLQAFKYFSVLAEIGNPKAQMRLGVMYMDGLGIDKSQRTANYWLLKSAKGGNTRAIHMIMELKNELRRKKNEERIKNEMESKALKEIIPENIKELESKTLEEGKSASKKGNEKNDLFDINFRLSEL